MRRFSLALVMCLLATPLASAQDKRLAPPKVSTLPAACNVGDIVNLTTTTVGDYVCIAANTWSDDPLGSTTITDVTVVGDATVGGTTTLGGDTTIGNGKAIKTNSTTGHTAKFQAYDTDTGPGYVTFATFTNGTAPSFVISPPAGGSTVSVSGRHIAAGATPSVANVGANSCGTDAATIAGNDNTGIVTVGATAGTQCRITFTAAAANRWQCMVNDETTAVLARTTYVDTTHVDLSGVFTAGDVLSYICMPR